MKNDAMAYVVLATSTSPATTTPQASPEVLEKAQQLDGRLRARQRLPGGQVDVVHENQQPPARRRRVVPLALLLQSRLQLRLRGCGGSVRREVKRGLKRAAGGLRSKRGARGRQRNRWRDELPEHRKE